jgi:hypothetical protein
MIIGDSLLLFRKAYLRPDGRGLKLNGRFWWFLHFIQGFRFLRFLIFFLDEVLSVFFKVGFS